MCDRCSQLTQQKHKIDNEKQVSKSNSLHKVVAKWVPVKKKQSTTVRHVASETLTKGHK